MSGGHFNYDQFKILEMGHDIETIITRNEYDYNFKPETIEKFKLAAETLHRAYIMAHRIDWLLSGDDGEDTFHKRWVKDLQGVKGVE